MKKIIVMILLNVFLGLAAGSEAANEKNQTESGRKTYALIVGGISKDKQDRLDKSKAMSDLYKLLIDNPEINKQTLTILMADDSTVHNEFKKSSTANIQEAINAVGKLIESEDRFIFYYIGQANIIAEQLRFNLPGADITQEQLVEWIKAIDVSSMLIVLDCPGSGLAAKAISGRGRVVICSCTEQQRYSTHFSEHFVPALIDDKVDINANGRISILEAFTAASRRIDDWYRRKKLLTTEIPVLEDNGDGIPSKQPWKYKIDKADGLTASEFYLLKRQE